MIKIFYKISPQIFSHSLLLLHRRRGLISRQRVLKNSVFCVLAALIIASGLFLIMGFDENGEFDKSFLPFNLLFSVTVFLVISVASIVLFRKIKEKQLQNNARVMYDYGFEMKSPHCFSVCADFLENTSGYIKNTIAYDDIECVISDKFALTVLLDGEETVISIPKEGQMADTLFQADNMLREKLGERFIYEMDEKQCMK